MCFSGLFWLYKQIKRFERGYMKLSDMFLGVALTLYVSYDDSHLNHIQASNSSISKVIASSKTTDCNG